jgi:hypothetical protein
MQRGVLMRKRLLLPAILLAGLFAGSCTNVHHSPGGLSQDQTPPSMGDYNNPCNPHSHSRLGSQLPRKDLCYEQPNGASG